MTEGYSERLYRILVGMARGVFRLVYPPKVMGRENIPEDIPYILCANHISMRDPVLVATIVKQPLHFMAKRELFETKFKWFPKLIKKLGAFPVSRGDGDLTAIRTSLSILKEGECLGIFGQGTRRKKGDTEEPPMNTGVAMLAVRSKVPVVPLYIQSPYRLFRCVRVFIGKPLEFSDIKRADMATLTNVTEQISDAVFSLNAPMLKQ